MIGPWKLLRDEQDWRTYIDCVIEAGQNTRYQFSGEPKSYPCLAQTILLAPIVDVEYLAPLVVYKQVFVTVDEAKYLMDFSTLNLLTVNNVVRN